MNRRFGHFSARLQFVNVAFALFIGFSMLSVLLLPSHAQAKNIKMGVIDCYSGPPAVYGKDALNGFKLALEEINAKGVLGDEEVRRTCGI